MADPVDQRADARDRFGDPIIVVPRARLIESLAGLIPSGALSLSTRVTSVSAEGRIVTGAGEEIEADLVVAADGIGSAARAALFPGHPGLRYSGFTTWRFITRRPRPRLAPAAAHDRIK